MKPPALALALVVLASAPALARADDTVAERCARDAEAAQPLRRKSEYVRALEKLRACASAACPAIVAADCARWEAEVTDALPTLVFGARDERGRDVEGATVSVDGATPTPVDGRALGVDPGEHQLVFRRPSGEEIRESVVALASQKGRLVVATFPATAEPAAPAPPPTASALGVPRLGASTEPGAPTPPRARSWIWPITLGGAAVVLGGVGGVLGVSADHRYREMQTGCGNARSCTDAEIDGNRRAFVVADVFLVSAALAAAAAVIVYATER